MNNFRHTPEPYFVHRHSLEWVDTDGIKHLHVICSNDLDDVLRQVRTVKASIKVTRPRDQKPTSVPTDALDPDSWINVEQLVERIPALTIWQMRKLLERREQNGLHQCVRKVGKRLWIREGGFNKWLEQQPHA